MRGSAGEVVFVSDVCAKTPKVQIPVPRLLALIVEFRSSWFTVAV